MRWLCVYLNIYVYIHRILYISKYHGCSMYPDTTVFRHNKAIIRGAVHRDFPMLLGGRSQGLRSGQSLDRWKTLQIHNVRTRPSSPLCPWRIYRCIEWVIGLGSFGAKVEECRCQMMWWYPLGFVPVIICLFTFCNCSHRIDVWDMFTYIWLMFDVFSCR